MKTTRTRTIMAIMMRRCTRGIPMTPVMGSIPGTTEAGTNPTEEDEPPVDA